jgi:hypothetical protein
MRNFKELRIWQKEVDIAVKLSKGDQSLLQNLKENITDQQKMLTGFQQKLNP